MAIIYTYPVKGTPVGDDKLLMSDSNGGETKQATITSIKDTINVVDSITATLPISVSASTGAPDISSREYGGGAITGHVPSGGDGTKFLRGDGGWVVPTNTTDITLTTTGTSGASTWNGTTLNIPQYSDGVDGSGTANQVPIWSDSDTLTDSIMKQVGSGTSAKLVIGGNPNNGLTFENTEAGVPDVTLLPFNGPSGPNWDMRLPEPPTTGGQVMSLPSTLGSSPYQLEWANKAVINSAGGTFLGIGTPTNTTANLALGSVASPLLNTTDNGDVGAAAIWIEVQIGTQKYYMALYDQN